MEPINSQIPPKQKTEILWISLLICSFLKQAKFCYWSIQCAAFSLYSCRTHQSFPARIGHQDSSKQPGTTWSCRVCTLVQCLQGQDFISPYSTSAAPAGKASTLSASVSKTGPRCIGLVSISFWYRGPPSQTIQMVRLAFFSLWECGWE